MPQSAGAGIQIAADDGAQVSLSIPASGSADVQGQASVFDGTGTDNSVAVESTADGVRALVDITGPDAPERYAFDVGGDAASLSTDDDGSVTVLGADGTIVGHVATPWALDANGTPIPTHFEVSGTTLTQVVEHHSGSYAYPVVADPFWSSVVHGLSIAWKVTKCAAAVASLFFVGSKAYRIIKDLGGVIDAAKVLVGAGDLADFTSTAGHAAAAVLGISTIRSACF